MKKSTRALLGLVLLDAIILIGAWYMVAQTKSGAGNSNDPAASIEMISTGAGALVGFSSVVLLLAFVMHRRAGN